MQLQELKSSLRSTIEESDERLLRMMLAMAEAYNQRSTTEDISSEEQALSSDSDMANDQLYRLVYTSARTPSCDDDCIKDILKAAARNNPALGLTGILIYTPKRFLQILEGPYENVTRTYQKIEKDPRHGGSQMRYCQPADERHFGNWHMANKGIGKNEKVDYATAVSEEEKELYAALMDGNLHDYKDDGMRVLKTFLMVS